MKYDFPIIIPVAVLRVYGVIYRIVCLLRTWLIGRLWSVSIGRGTIFEGKTIVRTRRKQSILIGNSTIFNANGLTNRVGLTGPTILDTSLGGCISVGDHSGLSSVVMSSKQSISIGNHVKVGGNVRIFDHDFHSMDPDVRRSADDCINAKTKAVIIEDDVFIGTNAIILKGTHLGARTIVAAGSVVFGLDVPPGSLVKGNPATVVR